MIIDAKKPYPFNITEAHSVRGCQLDANYCAVAEALKDSYHTQKKKILAVQVGVKRTVLVLPGKEIRYQTPKVLADALRVFDETHVLDVPAGKYRLLPLPKSLTKKYVRNRP